MAETITEAKISKSDHTTRADIHKRLLKLPQSKQTITRTEHNQVLEGYTKYMNTVAEGTRQGLVFLHLAVEKFMQTAGDEENRLSFYTSETESFVKEHHQLNIYSRMKCSHPTARDTGDWHFLYAKAAHTPTGPSIVRRAHRKGSELWKFMGSDAEVVITFGLLCWCL